MSSRDPFPRAGRALRTASALLDLLGIVRTPGDRMRLAVAGLVLGAKRLPGMPQRLTVAVGWQGPRRHQRAFLGDLSELRVLRQVFARGEYWLPTLDPEVILDLGSNIGMSVLYLHDLFPGARIIAVEASADAFARLQRNVGHLPRVDLVPAAIGDRDATVTFRSTGESWGGSVTSLVTSSGSEAGNGQAVQSLTVESVLAGAGVDRVDLVKMDIEGAETEILDASQALREARVIAFEFHQEYSRETVFSLLARLPEFEVLRMDGDSRRHPLVTLRRR